MAGYYAAVAQGQKSGQAGRVVPSQTGPGSQIKYSFVPSGGGGGGIDYGSFLRDFQKRETGAREANLARETEIRGTYDEELRRLQTGGAFKESELARIGRAETREIGLGKHANITGGLFGTTVQGSTVTGAANRAEIRRGTLEGVLEQQRRELRLGKAAFVERIEDPYPDFNLLLQAMAARGSL